MAKKSAREKSCAGKRRKTSSGGINGVVNEAFNEAFNEAVDEAVGAVIGGDSLWGKAGIMRHRDDR